jgi:hypothetical protein
MSHKIPIPQLFLLVYSEAAFPRFQYRPSSAYINYMNNINLDWNNIVTSTLVLAVYPAMVESHEDKGTGRQSNSKAIVRLV